jgi:hypothetical protein
MAAMFTRNKFIGWYDDRSEAVEVISKSIRASVVFAIQNWLGESNESKKSASQPAIFSVGMSGEPLVCPMFKCSN